jgi:hypothetical protein
VRFRRYRFSPTGDLGYSGTRGAVGLGHTLTVYKRTLPPAPSSGWFGFIVNSKEFFKLEAKVLTGSIPNQVALGLKPVGKPLLAVQSDVAGAEPLRHVRLHRRQLRRGRGGAGGRAGGARTSPGPQTLLVTKSIAELTYPRSSPAQFLDVPIRCRFKVSLFKPSLKALHPLNRLWQGLFSGTEDLETPLFIQLVHGFCYRLVTPTATPPPVRACSC